MPTQIYLHTPISMGRSTTTKCRLHQWAAESKSTRSQINEARGIIIQSTDGIFTRHPSTIEFTTATSNRRMLSE